MNKQDTELRLLLRDHILAEPVRNAAFRAEVWARIEARGRGMDSWPGWLRAHAGGFVLVALIGILLAVTGGGLLAANEKTRRGEKLVEQYLASIDPHRRE